MKRKSFENFYSLLKILRHDVHFDLI